MRLVPNVLAFVFTSAAVVAVPRVAQAGLEACNNINVSAEAKCKVEVKGGCTAQCEPVKFEAACAGKLEASCSGQCNAQASASCTGTCKGDCTGKCSADPGSLDCKGDCSVRCEGDCSAKCSASSNGSSSQGECAASCKATCGGSCDAQCTGTPPSATCDVKCEASCKGSCEGKANIDCQGTCQSKGYVDCKASLSGGCKTQCEKPEGALFCDGNYVDAGNNLQDCVAALNAVLKVKVDASASGEASCDGGECSANGAAKASASCAVAPGTGMSEGLAADRRGALDPRVLLAGVGILAIAVAKRKRRRAA
jgi:hypothetical protein